MIYYLYRVFFFRKRKSHHLLAYLFAHNQNMAFLNWTFFSFCATAESRYYSLIKHAIQSIWCYQVLSSCCQLLHYSIYLHIHVLLFCQWFTLTVYSWIDLVFYLMTTYGFQDYFSPVQYIDATVKGRGLPLWLRCASYRLRGLIIVTWTITTCVSVSVSSIDIWSWSHCVWTALL
jgi:hypothetical protein